MGRGKTHLLNAIGNQLAERSDVRIAYVTTEQFTNEVINSIRYDKSKWNVVVLIPVAYPSFRLWLMGFLV